MDEFENLLEEYDMIIQEIETEFGEYKDEKNEKNENGEDEIEEYEDDETNDDHSPRNTYISTLSEDDIIELEHTVYELADDYLEQELCNFYSTTFIDSMVNDILQVLSGDSFDEEKEEELEEFIKSTLDNYFEITQHIPRSYKNTFPIERTPAKIKDLDSQLALLREQSQTTQKSKEWTELRQRLLTASNLYKVFGSQAQINSLIYEKCAPLTVKDKYVNVNSSLHWGNKFEPVSIMFYEHYYKTQIEPFGCIIHPQHRFIGASPDGINCQRDSPLYGRMLEIKNIFNRDIDGIPKNEYWVQMQIQMEVCKLEECDFLETRFKTYESEDDFYTNELLHDTRGVILYFVNKITDFENINNEPVYEYIPLEISIRGDKEEIDAWIENKRNELKKTHSLYEIQYYYLDEFSCVLVKRNSKWFESAFPKIKEIFETIERERVEGYEHRAPNKRERVEIKKENDVATIKNIPTTSKVCLVKVGQP
jgi:putative phage-type endonuclease